MRSAAVFLLSILLPSAVAVPQEGKGKGKGGGPIVSPYQKDDSGGSGPYKAQYVADPDLAKHTIYSPENPPKEPMPLIVWGEGACASQGTAFVNLLIELASYGYVVIANGAPGTPGQPFGDGQTTAAELTKSMDWVTQGKDAGKYGTIDKNKMAAAGQSCGGMEAMSVSNDPRIKFTGMFNSGGLGGVSPNAKTLNHPIAYFLGGTGDIAYQNGELEYKALPATAPAIKFNMDGAGHGGTYGEKQAGKFGKAAVAVFNYVLKGNATAKAMLFDDTFTKDGWEVEFKNWDSYEPL